MELREPVALLLNGPLDVYQAAVRHGYRPFTGVDEFKAYVPDLETLGVLEPVAA